MSIILTKAELPLDKCALCTEEPSKIAPAAMRAASKALGDLKRAEEKFRALIEASPVGVFRADSDGQCFYVNDRWCAIAGMSPEKAMGKGWGHAIHPDDMETVFNHWQLAVETRTPFKKEYRFLRPDGVETWVYGLAAMEKDASGKTVGFVGTITDITERKHAEQTAFQYQEQLRAISAQLLQTEESERRRIASDLHDQVGQTLAACRIELGECLSLVDDVQLKSKIQKTRLLLEQSIQETRSLTFDLSPPVLTELGLIQALHWLAEKHTRPEGPLIACHAPASLSVGQEPSMLLFRITRELVLNAIKHAAARRISISIASEPGRLRIQVVDDGVGFAAETVINRGGSAGGFGLFSIRDRLRFLGGRLDCESAPGKGSHITVTVPLDMQP